MYYSRSCTTVVRIRLFPQTVGQSHSPGPQLAEVPLGLEGVGRETGEHGAGEEERLQHDPILIEAHCRGGQKQDSVGIRRSVRGTTHTRQGLYSDEDAYQLLPRRPPPAESTRDENNGGLKKTVHVEIGIHQSDPHHPW